MFSTHTTDLLPTRVATTHLSSLNISHHCRLPTWKWLNLRLQLQETGGNPSNRPSYIGLRHSKTHLEWMRSWIRGMESCLSLHHKQGGWWQPWCHYSCGNTHVTITWACLLVDSRQQHVCWLIYILTGYPITQALFLGPRHRLRLILGPPKFLFPTHPLLLAFYTTSTPIYTHLHTPCIHFYPVEEVRWWGFILPSPLSFAPQRSRLTIDFFGTPCRLLARTKLTSTCKLRKHPQDGKLHSIVLSSISFILGV